MEQRIVKEKEVSDLAAQVEQLAGIKNQQDKFEEFILREFQKIKDEMFKQHILQQQVLEEVPTLTNMCETAHKNCNDIVIKFNQLESIVNVRLVKMQDNYQVQSRRDKTASSRIEIFQKDPNDLAQEILGL